MPTIRGSILNSFLGSKHKRSTGNEISLDAIVGKGLGCKGSTSEITGILVKPNKDAIPATAFAPMEVALANTPITGTLVSTPAAAAIDDATFETTPSVFDPCKA